MVASLEILLHAIYYLSTLTYLHTSLSGMTIAALGSQVTRADDHWVIQQLDE